MELRDFLQLIGVLITFLMALGAFVGFLKRELKAQFKEQDQKRAEGATTLKEKIDKYAATAERTSAQVLQLEREFMDFKAKLPEKFVLREDAIRGQLSLEARLDRLYPDLQEVRTHLAVLTNKTKGTSDDR